VWERHRAERERLARGAVVAFDVLGRRAAPAAGQLARLVKVRGPIAVPDRALMALSYIGEEGIRPLVAVLNDDESRLRFAVGWYIGRLGAIGVDVSGAVPKML